MSGDRYTYRPEGLSDTEWAERLAAHRAEHGWAWLQCSNDGGKTWWATSAQHRSNLALSLGQGTQYRLVHPEPPAPQDDEPRRYAIDTIRRVAAAARKSEGVGLVAAATLEGWADLLDAAPVLPPGVTRCTAADGTKYLTALGRDVPLLLPGGWKWLAGAEVWAADRVPLYDDQSYVVRPPEPPAEPRTVTVEITEDDARAWRARGQDAPVDVIARLYRAFGMALADTDGEAPQ